MTRQVRPFHFSSNGTERCPGSVSRPAAMQNERPKQVKLVMAAAPAGRELPVPGSAWAWLKVEMCADRLLVKAGSYYLPQQVITCGRARGALGLPPVVAAGCRVWGGPRRCRRACPQRLVFTARIPG